MLQDSKKAAKLNDSNSKRAVIFSGGEFSIPENFLIHDDFVIACDKGFDYAIKSKVKVDFVTGDFDSLESEIPKNIPSKIFPKEKDDSDTMIALKYAISLGFKNVVILCPFGKRLDHTIANLQTAVFAAKKGIKCTLISNETEIHALNGKNKKISSIKIPKREGFSISLFAFDSFVKGINSTGLKWNLKNKTLTSSFPLGLSNEWINEDAEISVKKGVILVVMSRIFSSVNA